MRRGGEKRGGVGFGWQPAIWFVAFQQPGGPDQAGGEGGTRAVASGKRGGLCFRLWMDVPKGWRDQISLGKRRRQITRPRSSAAAPARSSSVLACPWRRSLFLAAVFVYAVRGGSSTLLICVHVLAYWLVSSRVVRSPGSRAMRCARDRSFPCRRGNEGAAPPEPRLVGCILQPSGRPFLCSADAISVTVRPSGFTGLATDPECVFRCRHGHSS